MKKAVIILSGKIKIKAKIYKQYLNSDSYDIYCADGGANYAYKFGIIPKLIIGDFDSISHAAKTHFKQLGVKFDKFPVLKDFTDGELIINKFHNKYKELIILGGQGGRTDHFLSNLYLSEKYPNIKFINHKEEIFMIKSGYEFIKEVGTTVSFIPISKEVKGISLIGFKFPLNNKNIERGSSLTMSNEIIDDFAQITWKSGKLLAIINYK